MRASRYPNELLCRLLWSAKTEAILYVVANDVRESHIERLHFTFFDKSIILQSLQSLERYAVRWGWRHLL